MTKRGFTLIELLIVIAILGTLAVVVLIAINPQERLAQTRDSGRINGVKQLSTAIDGYLTGNEGVPPAYSGWMQKLVDAGELSGIVSGISAGSGHVSCFRQPYNSTWCYHWRVAEPGWGYVVYSTLESDKYMNRCLKVRADTGKVQAMYSSFDNKMLLICGATGWDPYTRSIGWDTWGYSLDL